MPDRLSGNEQTAVGAAEAGSVLCGRVLEAASMLQVVGHEPEPPILRQTAIGMNMHGA